MEEYGHIDKIFQEQQHQFEKMPSPDLWQRLDTELDAIVPERPIVVATKSRRRWWYYVAAVFLLFIIPLSLLFINTQHLLHQELAQKESIVSPPMRKSVPVQMPKPTDLQDVEKDISANQIKEKQVIEEKVELTKQTSEQITTTEKNNENISINKSIPLLEDAAFSNGQHSTAWKNEESEEHINTAFGNIKKSYNQTIRIKKEVAKENFSRESKENIVEKPQLPTKILAPTAAVRPPLPTTPVPADTTTISKTPRYAEYAESIPKIVDNRQAKTASKPKPKLVPPSPALPKTTPSVKPTLSASKQLANNLPPPKPKSEPKLEITDDELIVEELEIEEETAELDTEKESSTAFKEQYARYSLNTMPIANYFPDISAFGDNGIGYASKAEYMPRRKKKKRQQSENQQKTSEVFLQLKQFLGNWQATSREGVVIKEKWQQVNPQQLKGEAFSFLNDDIVFIEQLNIEQVNQDIIYTSYNKHTQQTRSFKLIKHEDNKLIFENTSNRFPSQITYTQQTDNSLSLTFEGIKDNKNLINKVLYIKK